MASVWATVKRFFQSTEIPVRLRWKCSQKMSKYCTCTAEPVTLLPHQSSWDFLPRPKYSSYSCLRHSNCQSYWSTEGMGLVMVQSWCLWVSKMLGGKSWSWNFHGKSEEVPLIPGPQSSSAPQCWKWQPHDRAAHYKLALRACLCPSTTCLTKVVLQ